MIKIDFTTKPTVPKYVVNAFGDKYLLNENKQRHSYNDLPSVVGTNGTRYWHKNDFLHREEGKPAVIWSNGEKEYWENGIRIK